MPSSDSKAPGKNKQRKPGWELNSGLFEICWKRGNKGLYADKVRINGVTFYFIDAYTAGHKTWPLKRERQP